MLLRAARLACLAGLSCAIAACSGAGGGTDEAGQEVGNAPHILALGDSMAFGWDPLLQPDPTKVVASNYRGYAELLGARHGYVVDNASCPGEASGSFIDANQSDNGCRANRAAYRMHLDWDSYVGHHVGTQLELVETYLQRSVAAGTPPKLITMSLGGNDLLLLQKACQLPGPLKGGCELVRLPFFAHGFEEHIESIFAAIESSGYRGPVAVLTTYAPDYNDHIANLGLGAFNDKLREAVGHAKDDHPDLHIVVADGYAAFKEHADKVGGKTCATGLLIKLPDGSCDIHPTQLGHQVLAQAIEDAVDGASGGGF